MNFSQSSVDTVPPTILPFIALGGGGGVIIRGEGSDGNFGITEHSDGSCSDTAGGRSSRRQRTLDGGGSASGDRQSNAHRQRHQYQRNTRDHRSDAVGKAYEASRSAKASPSSIPSRSGGASSSATDINVQEDLVPSRRCTRNVTFCITEDGNGTLRGGGGRVSSSSSSSAPRSSSGASEAFSAGEKAGMGKKAQDDAMGSGSGGVGGGGGYSIWRTWPLKRLSRREFPGTLAAVHPLPLTSLVLLHGGGRDPLHPPNKLVVYDDDAGRKIAELEFREQVRAVRCRLGGFVVLLSRSAIYFEYGMRSQKEEDDDEEAEIAPQPHPSHAQQPVGSIADYYASASSHRRQHRRSSISSFDSDSDAADDPPIALSQAPGFWVAKRGAWQTAEIARSSGGTIAADTPAIALSTHTGGSLLVIPGRQVGQLQIITLPSVPALVRKGDGSLEVDAISDDSPVVSRSVVGGVRPKQPIIVAHEHALACISLSASERHVATASTKGTLIRVWDTATGALVRELRRGMEHVEVLGIAFDGDHRLACWSDKGSIHVWNDILAPLQAGGHRGDRTDTGHPSGPATTTSRLKSMLNPLKAYLPQSASYFQALPSSCQYYLQRDAQLRSPMPTLSFSEPGFTDVEPPQPTPKELKLGEKYVVGWIDFTEGDFEPDPPEPDEWPEWQRAFADKVRPPPRVDRPDGVQLLVLTHSGEYLRLSLPEENRAASTGDDDDDDDDSDDPPSSSSVGQDGRDHSRKRYRHRCKVEEYRTLQTVVSS